eukprot:GFUD01022647.1.p1 GENE.GFUD01022647.1~~GFUD01022647.1.p1  ORF type:complete len:367 (+),score=75.01 GFUD01022647.1:390-1490(+)
MKLKVITLNCWGIPWSIPTISSPDRSDRFEAIGDFLSSEKYDFVFLQEVWDEQDYFKLANKLSRSLPHSFYFKAGTIGSGTCIFSVVPIDQVFNKTFSINGYPHQVWRGDGLAGSGVGAVQVTLEEKKILLCVTHFHAEYSGEFQTDRAAQAWEVRNFVKQVDQGDKLDLLVLAGDLNSLPGELPHKILTSCLKDCWQGNYAITFGNPSNSYAGKEEAETLDYIFVKEGSKVQVTVQKTSLPLEHTIPYGNISYSDHEAVETELLIEDREISSAIESQKILNKMPNENIKALALAIKSDLYKTDGYQFEYLAICFVIFVMIMFFQNWVLNSVLTVIFCFCFSMATLTLQTRKVALQNIMQQIEIDQ